jgi:hypothetical protein
MSDDEDVGNLGNIAASGSEQSNTARSAAGGASNQIQDCAPLSWTSERADTFFVCERVRKAAATQRNPQRAGASNPTPPSRAAVLSQAGAPLSWTSERADTFFVCERVRKAAATQRDPRRAERAIRY